MLTYNLALLGLSSFTIGNLVILFFITFTIAFISESLVEPVARKLALSLPKLNFILAIALCMVPMMVLIMSGYGLFLTMLTTGIESSIFTAYLKVVGLNIIVALPSQLLIVGPISRKLLAKYVKPTQKMNLNNY